jgi:hypothetical protein
MPHTTSEKLVKSTACHISSVNIAGSQGETFLLHAIVKHNTRIRMSLFLQNESWPKRRALQNRNFKFRKKTWKKGPVHRLFQSTDFLKTAGSAVRPSGPPFLFGIFRIACWSILRLMGDSVWCVSRIGGAWYVVWYFCVVFLNGFFYVFFVS